MSGALLHTAFHARTAERNTGNACISRGGFTVPAHYGEPHQEAVAARFSCVLADVSSQDELKIEGQGATALLRTAFGSNVPGLETGQSRAAFWCSDGGGLRGIGSLVRRGENLFVLSSADCDMSWFGPQASRFNVSLRETAADRGLLLLAGPFATAVLAAAGIERATTLGPDAQLDHDWNGVSLLLSREPRLNAFMIASPAEAGVAVFDHLMRAGRTAGLRLAGQQAVDILSLEAGVPIAHVDFTPARTPDARDPLPSWFGFASQGTEVGRVLAGLEFNGAEPYPFAPISHGTAPAGQTLRSVYSLALKRAIALAQIELKFAVPGTILQVRARRRQGFEDIPARVVALPFL